MNHRTGARESRSTALEAEQGAGEFGDGSLAWNDGVGHAAPHGPGDGLKLPQAYRPGGLGFFQLVYGLR